MRGEIGTNYQLDQFVFSGLDKLGTLVSMVYGIRALKQAGRGIAGIHSASVWDEQLQ